MRSLQWSRGLAALLFSTVFLVLPTARPVPVASAGEPAKEKSIVSAKDAFAKLKSLAGTWVSKPSEGDHGEHAEHNSKVNYRLTGAGTALVETMLPGSDHEMTSVYHLDGDDLRMTHYCAVGNQPRLKLDRVASTPEKLVFVFDGGTNLDPAKDMYISGLTMTFPADGRVQAVWQADAGGKKKAHTTAFDLSREKP